MTSSTSPPVAPGTKIGPYEVVSWLGAGGMGVVYRARDPRIGREVAIKLIPEALALDASRLGRFEQETRASGQLNHPNILAVYDVGIHAGAPYIVSELLEGESIRSLLSGGALTPRKAVDYARQLTMGLAAAHDKGIVHRDVKPDNLFVTKDGRVKILDFGVAKLTLPSDSASGHTGLPTETAAGIVVGTAGYMSPEQVRGETVDGRSDLFSVGTVLHEMLTGHQPFARETAAETMTAILKEDPREPLPASVPPALARIVSRCLEKTREMRFQSARDLAFGLEVLSDTAASAVPASTLPAMSRSWRPALGVAVVGVSLTVAAVSWLGRGTPPPALENLLTNAQFSRLTDWEGTEGAAQISPDGRFVAFLADRAGEFDVWLTQVGTGEFKNLTADLPPVGGPSAVLRNIGFTGDGAGIWYSATGDAGGRKAIIPLTGGAPRPFLGAGDVASAWSPDSSRLVYFNNRDGDPLLTADGNGADPRPIAVTQPGFFAKGLHSHNPVWSPDGQSIYFVHGLDPTTAMEIWRVSASGGTAEQLTNQHAPANFLTPLDSRTLLYVSRTEDQTGPWLWALDLDRKVTRRVTSGLEQYTSVSASRDGRRIVATVSNSVASLWRVPLQDRISEEGDVHPYPLPTARALAPRFGGTSLFYLSSHGMGDGLWRYQDGQSTEVGRGLEGAMPEVAAVSRDGSRVAVEVSRSGKRRLVVMSADGTDVRTLTEAIDVRGAAGLGPADWSPDGQWIVVGGADNRGEGLFKIPFDGGAPVRLVDGQANNPIWSPQGDLIVYSGPLVAGLVTLVGVRPDGTRVDLPNVRARINSAYRFTPDGTGLVYLTLTQPPDFWLLDLATQKTRQITHLRSEGAVRAFDITPDGKEIVFDRSKEDSNIHLIELPK